MVYFSWICYSESHQPGCGFNYQGICCKSDQLPRTKATQIWQRILLKNKNQRQKKNVGWRVP